jgi:hypothetical protein
MLTYLSAAKTVDFMIDGVEEYTGVTIISNKNIEIGEMISEKPWTGYDRLQWSRWFWKAWICEIGYQYTLYCYYPPGDFKT